MVIGTYSDVLEEIRAYLAQESPSFNLNGESVYLNHPLNGIAPPSPYVCLFGLPDVSEATPDIAGFEPLEITVFVSGLPDQNLTTAVGNTMKLASEVRRSLRTGFELINCSRINAEIITSDTCLLSFTFTTMMEA